MDPDDIISGVVRFLSARAQKAHDHFVKDNPSLENATWAEILEELLQEQAHPALVDAIYEDLMVHVPINYLGYIVPVFFTLLYANQGHVPYAAEVAYYTGRVAALVEREVEE